MLGNLPPAGPRQWPPQPRVDFAQVRGQGGPDWNACLANLRAGDTLVIWKIDRLGRNLRDLVDIVTTHGEPGVGVKSLTNGIVDINTRPPTTALTP